MSELSIGGRPQVRPENKPADRSSVSSSAAPSAAMASDRLTLNQSVRGLSESDRKNLQKGVDLGMHYGTVGVQVAAGAAMIRSAVKASAPVASGRSLLGKVMPVVGIAVTTYQIGQDLKALSKDLSAPSLDARKVAQHGLALTGDALVLGGSIAAATGVGGALGTIAVGSGLIVSAGSELLSP